jgi:hypothetical protein
VVENGKLVGILTDCDLEKHCGCLETTKVSAAMTWSQSRLHRRRKDNLLQAFAHKNVRSSEPRDY